MAARTHERILDAATRLFAEEGILATSMDRVIAEAEVAPMTVYRQFGSKDALVAATLDRWSVRWLSWLGEELERAGDEQGPPMAILWDTLEKWFASEGFRGSYVANAATELRCRPGHPAHRVVATHRAATRRLLEQAAGGAGGARPEVVAMLQLLLDGATMGAALDRQPAAAASARATAGAAIASWGLADR